jgi:hypothetical protein
LPALLASLATRSRSGPGFVCCKAFVPDHCAKCALPRPTSAHLLNGGLPGREVVGTARILADGERHGLTEADTARVGQWIRESVDRVNFLVDERLGMRVLTLLEAFLQCRLNPCYEGFKSQNTVRE